MAFQRIRIKNTNVAGKVPGADKLDTAELCINLKDQKLYSKDTNGDVFEIAGGSNASVPGGPTPPTINNEIGDLFFDTDLEILLYWDGTEWVPVAGQDQWVVDRVSAGSTPVITPQDQNTDIGCGGASRTDPDASLSTDGRVFLRRTDGTDDPKIVMATDNGRVGLVEFTSDGPGSQRVSQWEFKDSPSSPGGDDGQVVIKAQGGIDIRATGADDACINVAPQRSRNWGTSEDDDDAIRVRNFSVNVFEAGDMGAVTARKSFTVGSVGTGGENIPGFFQRDW